MTQNTVTHGPWAKIEFSTTIDPNVVHTSNNLPLNTLIGEAAEFPLQTVVAGTQHISLPLTRHLIFLSESAS